MFDLAQLTRVIDNAIWWALPLLLLLALMRLPAFRGLVGSWALQLAVKLTLDQNDYHMYRHVTLPLANGTARIDHLLVSQYGVFMCETNSMRGLISGGRDQATWICQLGKHEYPFHNPLLQHHRHARLLAAMLGLEAGRVLPALVFVGDAGFRTRMPEQVTKIGGYIRFIKSKSIPVFTRADVARLGERIAAGLEPAGQSAAQPAKRSGKAAGAKKAKTQTCPRCGSAMVLRVANKGAMAGKKFWVCSSYPKCKSAIAAGARPKRPPEFGRPKLT